MILYKFSKCSKSKAYALFFYCKIIVEYAKNPYKLKNSKVDNSAKSVQEN
jgi:hypothetical protein